MIQNIVAILFSVMLLYLSIDMANFVKRNLWPMKEFSPRIFTFN